MRYGLYSIKDNVTGKYGDIYIAINENQAVRQFDLICSKSDFAKDLSLFALGNYNLDTGVIESSVDFIKNGVDYEEK